MKTVEPVLLTVEEWRNIWMGADTALNFETWVAPYRERGLIRPEPDPVPLVEIELEKAIEGAVFQDDRNRIPWSNGFRNGFVRARELALQDTERWLRTLADGAALAWQEEESKPDMGELFWRRYWAGYFTALDSAAKGVCSMVVVKEELVE